VPARVFRFPGEVLFPAKKVYWPLVTVAAFGADGILVLAGQRTNGCAGVLFAPGLESVKKVVRVAEGEAMDWQPRQLVAMPDGRFLLCTIGRGGMSIDNQNLFIDGATMAVTPATALVGVAPSGRSNIDERNTSPRDVLFLGDRALIGHGCYYGNVDDYQSFSAVPADGAGDPLPWLQDLDQQMGNVVGISFGHQHVVRGAALSDRVVLACQGILRSGSHSHALVAVNREGRIIAHRADDRARIRDDLLQLAADLPRQSVHIYARGSLEVVDRDLRTVAQAPAGHPFLKGFRLLAGDGQGRLLWSSARRKMFLLSQPEDLRLDDLGSSLDAMI